MTKEELQTFLFEKAGFCGCGSPEVAANEVKRILTILRNQRDKDEYLPTDHPDSLYVYRETPAGQIVLYWLDHIGLTEHGISAPGWLTPEGRAVLEALEKYPDWRGDDDDS